MSAFGTSAYERGFGGAAGFDLDNISEYVAKLVLMFFPQFVPDFEAFEKVHLVHENSFFLDDTAFQELFRVRLDEIDKTFPLILGNKSRKLKVPDVSQTFFSLVLLTSLFLTRRH